MTNVRENRQPVILGGRQCGACTVCCSILPINTNGLKKTANLLCEHCNEGQGCRIYETRPNVCRNFYCEWRLNPHIPATWRPEKSGVFVERVPREHIQDVPQGYGSDYAILFMLLRPDAIERPALIETVADYIFRRVPIFLSIPGPVGYFPAQVFLNEAMESAAARRDLDGMMIVLRQALNALKRQEFDRVPDLD